MVKRQASSRLQVQTMIAARAATRVLVRRVLRLAVVAVRAVVGLTVVHRVRAQHLPSPMPVPPNRPTLPVT